MAFKEQPDYRIPVNDPGVTILHRITNATSNSPKWQGNHIQPNTANPVVDPRVGTYTLKLNALNL